MAASPREDTLREAEACFREALRQEPELVEAMLGLAAHHVVAVGNMVESPEPLLSEADALLTRVLSKRPDWPEAHYRRGILHNMRGELEPGLEEFARTVELNPSSATGYAQMGRMLTRLARFDEALEHINYAIRLSPKDPALVVWSLYAGWAELERGHDAAAFQWISRAAALNPRYALVHASLAAYYALSGDRATADRHVAKLRELTPRLTDELRLEMTGAFMKRPAPHRLADGVRLALAGSQ
jgi:tetratricopeptide (TPR) repeat protein